MRTLQLSGDVVERQTYLNGTVYFLFEGGSDPSDCSWSLSVTLPKAEGEAITEGDFSLESEAGNWFAGVGSGEHTLTRDELTDDPLLAMSLVVVRRAGAESSVPCEAARIHLRVLVDSVLVELEWQR